MLVYQHLRAPNDTNGNPRRLYMAYDIENGRSYAKILRVYDEGYSDLPGNLRNLPELPTINIDIKTYRHFVKTAKINGKFANA